MIHKPDVPEPICDHKEHQNVCNYCEYMLQKQKKLVAEKLMGGRQPDITDGYWLLCNNTPISNWNPQTKRKWWDEIWEKMDKQANIRYNYMINLGEELGPFAIEFEVDIDEKYAIHTAKPEVRWKALIKTLE